MKTFFTLLILFSSASVQAQVPACCQKPVGMNAIALSAAFISAHEPPLPLDYTSKRGSIVSFNTEDGKKGSAFYVPAKEATSKVLLVFHEWWGLNDYIRRECERWQDSLGPVDVYAVDLYDGQVATTPDAASKLFISCRDTGRQSGIGLRNVLWISGSRRAQDKAPANRCAVCMGS